MHTVSVLLIKRKTPTFMSGFTSRSRSVRHRLERDWETILGESGYALAIGEDRADEVRRVAIGGRDAPQRFSDLPGGAGAHQRLDLGDLFRREVGDALLQEDAH